MLSFVVRSGRLEARRKPLPRVAPGWALVRVRLAGICNTDLEILRGYHSFRGTPGHEFVGEVVRVGAPSLGSKGGAIHKRWRGQRVVGEINIACAASGRQELCGYCRQGVPTHCLRRRVLGILNHDGSFAEFLALPLGNLHAVPEGVSDEQAVFTEPLAAACEILEQVRVRKHREAAVLGDGKLAQLIARTLVSAGLRVVMFGKYPSKLAVARAAGISTLRVNSAGPNVLRAYKRRWPLVVEATGSSSGLAQAVEMTAPRGTLVLKSTFHGVARLVSWPIVVHELTLVGSRCGPFPRALELLRTGRVDPRPLIMRVFPLCEAPAGICYARRPGVLKVLLKS